jgi:2-dehydro-3-deoxyphosphooctonate aldolase (KDO 8-P synthase)
MTVKIGKVKFGGGNPFVLISGPCVIESRAHAFKMAKELKAMTSALKIPFIFKASYDKANRTSIKSFRGLGMGEGLDILAEIKKKLNVPVTSDVHSIEEIKKAAAVIDIIQIPAFLSRQTDLLLVAGKSKKIVNIKKGQFLAPTDMQQAVEKVYSTGNKNVLLTERGTTFGYHNLVTDFRSLAIMRSFGVPVVIDASHSVQQPGGLGTASGGKSEFIPLMARCGVAAGCDAVFIETHDNPKKALSDGPNMVPLKNMKSLLKELKAIDAVVKNRKGK